MMCKSMEDMYNRAHEEGREEGRSRHLVELVCRKLRHGRSPEEIADALEEEPDVIRKICEAAEEFAPEYPEEKIWERL